MRLVGRLVMRLVIRLVIRLAVRLAVRLVTRLMLRLVMRLVTRQEMRSPGVTVTPFLSPPAPAAAPSATAWPPGLLMANLHPGFGRQGPFVVPGARTLREMLQSRPSITGNGGRPENISSAPALAALATNLRIWLPRPPRPAACPSCSCACP